MAQFLKYEHLPLPPIPNTNCKRRHKSITKTEGPITQIKPDFTIKKNTPHRNIKRRSYSYNNKITTDKFDPDRFFLSSKSFWTIIAQGKQNQDKMDRLVRRYFEAGGNPNVARLHRPIDRLKVGYSLVHALVLAGSTESLEIALQAGANPNYTPATENPGDMISPLVLAAREKSIDSVQLLVIYGARLFHSKGALGEGPLHAAVFSNSENIVYYLLKKSQNHLLKTTDFTGATPLHYAAMKGRCRIVLLFIKKGLLDLNCQDNNGDIPLHYAIRHRRLNMVKLLIEMSTNTHINVSDLLKLAKKNNAGAIAHYLRQIEVDVSNTKKVDSTKVCSENSKSECKYGCICVYNIGKLFKKHVVTKAHRLIKKK